MALASEIKLPSGLVLPNRLVKAAMAESLGEKNGDPSDSLIVAYDSWASGGWGGLLTGNVDVSTVYRGSNDGVVSPPTVSKATRDAWERWVLASQQHGTPTIVQLVHPGRQSPAGAGSRGFFEKAIAPSPLPLNIGDGILDRLLAKLAFGTPREMTVADIEEVVQQFAAAAKLSYESGFKGVELHGAHGYLLSQFLSSKINVRTDAYGGTAAKRTKIVVDVIRAIRKVVPATFSVSIKMNSADVGGAENLEESLEQVGILAQEEIDFLEISGGTYEKPRMGYGDGLKPIKIREAFFLDYAKAVRARYPNLKLMVTGGFRSRTGMAEALESNACDLIGIGRPAAIYPHWPKDTILNEKVHDNDATAFFSLAKMPWFIAILPIKLLGFGFDTTWYQTHGIKKLSEGKQTEAPPAA